MLHNYIVQASMSLNWKVWNKQENHFKAKKATYSLLDWNMVLLTLHLLNYIPRFSHFIRTESQQRNSLFHFSKPKTSRNTEIHTQRLCLLSNVYNVFPYAVYHLVNLNSHKCYHFLRNDLSSSEMLCYVAMWQQCPLQTGGRLAAENLIL